MFKSIKNIVFTLIVLAVPGFAAAVQLPSSWQTLPVYGGNVDNVTVNPNDSSGIYAVIAGKGVFQYNTKNKSWQSVTWGNIPMQQVNQILFTKPIPQYPQGMMYVKTSDTIYVNDTSMGGWVALPKLANFDVLSNMALDSQGNIYIGFGKGYSGQRNVYKYQYVSGKPGTWAIVGSQPLDYIGYIFIAQDDSIYITVGSIVDSQVNPDPGLLKLNSQTGNWDLVSAGLPTNQQYYQLVQNSAGDLFVSAQNASWDAGPNLGALFRLPAGQQQWQLIDGSSSNIPRVANLVVDSNTNNLFTVVPPDMQSFAPPSFATPGVYSVNPDKNSWSMLTGIFPQIINNVAFDQNHHTLFAATNLNGVSASTDGATWISATTGLQNIPLRTGRGVPDEFIQVLPNGRIVFVDNNQGQDPQSDISTGVLFDIMPQAPGADYLVDIADPLNTALIGDSLLCSGYTMKNGNYLIYTHTDQQFDDVPLTIYTKASTDSTWQNAGSFSQKAFIVKDCAASDDYLLSFLIAADTSYIQTEVSNLANPAWQPTILQANATGVINTAAVQSGTGTTTFYGLFSSTDAQGNPITILQKLTPQQSLTWATLTPSTTIKDIMSVNNRTQLAFYDNTGLYLASADGMKANLLLASQAIGFMANNQKSYAVGLTDNKTILYTLNGTGPWTTVTSPVTIQKLVLESPTRLVVFGTDGSIKYIDITSNSKA